MADRLILPRAVDANDDPVSGATLEVFDAGTSTPKTTYQDTGLVTPHPSSIEADSIGDFPAVYLTGRVKIHIKTPAGASLFGGAIDNFPSVAIEGGEAKAIPDDDADSLTESGFYTTDDNTTTLPSGIGEFGALIHVQRDTADRSWQLYSPAAGTAEQRMFYRTQTGAGWDDWGEVLHSESTSWRMPFGGDGGNTEAGIQLTQDGFAGFTRDADVALRLRRIGNGKIASWNTAGSEAGSITVSGGTCAYNTSSDARLKTPLSDFAGGVIIDALEVGHFYWVDGGDGYGVIAQDAYEVFPHCVSRGSEAGPGEEGFEPWGVDYSKLVPVLLRELQDVRKRLAALEYRED